VLAQQVPSAGDPTLSRAQPPARSVEAIISQASLSPGAVTTLHLRPLFTTTIRLPDAVSSVAVGAPTLFAVEHSDEEPRLVFVKPSTNQPAESNLVIAMRSGQEISLHLISDGTEASNAPVDFVVDYKPPQSFLIGSSDMLSPVSTAVKAKHLSPLDLALARESQVATPSWSTGGTENHPSSKRNPQSIQAAVGEITERDGNMMVAYSIWNTSEHWVEVLPPQIQMSSPGKETKSKAKKKHRILAEQVPIADYRMNGRKLASGERVDGAVEFARPAFKQSQERLMLQIATASSVDTPILLPVPFVAATH
jgi:hypothetical protein